MKVFDERWYAGLQAAEVKAASIIYWPRKPDAIVVHYAATDYDCTAAQVNEWHRKRGFLPRGSGPYPYMGYHRLIRMDGTVEVGRTDDVIGTHCLGHNDHTFGICLSGGLQTTGWPTEAQYRSLENELRRYVQRYGISLDRILRHDQLNRTSCPGRLDLHRVISRLKGGASSVRVEVKQVDLPSPWPNVYLGLAVVDCDLPGNYASFSVRFPAGKFKRPPLFVVGQPNSNTHWGANLGTSDVTAEGAMVYITDRGKVLEGAHFGIALLAFGID
jgi:hypothetical protein